MVMKKPCLKGALHFIMEAALIELEVLVSINSFSLTRIIKRMFSGIDRWNHPFSVMLCLIMLYVSVNNFLVMCTHFLG